MAPKKSLDEQQKLANEIKKIRKNIRKKHQTLTQNIIAEERFTEKSLKPIITPLQKLVEGNKNELPIKKNKEEREDVEMDDIQLRFKNKRNVDESEDESILHKRVILDPEMNVPTTPVLPQEETVYESLPTVKELLKTPEGRKSARYYIDNWFKGPVANQYMHHYFNDNNHNIDQVFGPYFGEDDIFMLGKYPMKIENDDITINDITYKGTPGLYDLIFMKRPNKDMYSEEDLSTYSHIMKETGAYLNLKTNKIKSSSSYKYKNIIKPMISQLSPRQHEGRGLLKLTDNKSDYVYWDNVNELCKRLQLLIASYNTGHTGHGNEIMSIIEELHEAGVIKEDAATFEAIFTK